ncbi:MAG: hypothetical protein ABIQ61_04270 [Ornithinibacter sp.]
MVAVVLALVLCLGLAVSVLALVALPARRQGREVLSARGEEVVGSLRERTDVGRLRREHDPSPVRPDPETNLTTV